jgi:cyclophilin family peptidyl-prolyl cis-trans isomerase
MGSFTADLRDEIVPITANNFILLTNQGFYNGLHFHRVIEGFMIQDGCPLGTGTGGPGWTIQDEFSPLLNHNSAGVLAMARTSQPNSAGSQYYITLAPTTWLNGSYAVFGKVFEGLDVVLSIGSVPTDSNDHPITNVYIDSLKILNMAINSVSPPTVSTVAFDATNPVPFIVEALGYTENVNFAWYIDDILQPQFTDFMLEASFSSNGMHTVKCVNTDSEMTWTTSWQVEVNNVHNSDETITQPVISQLTAYPNPFKEKTILTFDTKASTSLTLTIYDVKGRIVKSEQMLSSQGVNQWSWTPDYTVASGMYFVRLATDREHYLQKVILLK